MARCWMSLQILKNNSDIYIEANLILKLKFATLNFQFITWDFYFTTPFSLTEQIKLGFLYFTFNIHYLTSNIFEL